MDRIEFCEMMSVERNNRNVSIYSIQNKMGIQFGCAQRIGKGKHNFNLNKAIDFIAAFNCAIELQNDEMCFVVNDYLSFIEWFIKIRNAQNYTQRTLAEAVGYTHVTIANIERKKTILPIDTFLKLMDVLGYTIKIVDKQ